MIKLWIVVALILPICRAKQEKAEKSGPYGLRFTTSRGVSIEFANKDVQAPFPLNYNENGVVAGVFSRERPVFTVSGQNVDCYEVQVGSVPWSGIKP